MYLAQLLYVLWPGRSVRMNPLPPYSTRHIVPWTIRLSTCLAAVAIILATEAITLFRFADSKLIQCVDSMNDFIHPSLLVASVLASAV